MIRSTYAARPVAGTSGRLWLATDTPLMAMDDGTRWNEYYGTHPLYATNGMPSTWVNQGAGSIDVSKGGVNLLNPAVSGDQLRMQVKTIPAAPYTLILGFVPLMLDVSFISAGLVLRDSVSGKLVTAGPRTGSLMFVDKWNSATAFSANYVQLPTTYLPKSLVWVKVVDDNTNRMTYVSNDGVFWLLVHTVGRTDFITADQAGFYLQNNNTSYPVSGWFLSWQEA